MPTTDIEDHNDIRLADGVTAYHGSPHEFENFDTSKIGTGEGAQAYGHGLYFAENEGVAKSYRDDLSAKISVDGKPILDKNKQVGSTGDDYIDDILMAHHGDLDKAIEGEKIHIKSLQDLNFPTDHVEDTIKKLEELKGRVNASTPGHMYEVRIDAHPEEHLLDWDKPLSEQHPKIQEALSSHPQSRRLLGNDVVRGQLTAPTGQSILNRLLGNPEEKTKQLSEMGVRGIRYLDAGSRGKDGKTGSSNYVIFDPKHIKTVRRYAEGGGIKAFAIGNSIPHLERASDMIETHDDIQLSPDVEAIDEMPDQAFTSENTSRNQIPALFNSPAFERKRGSRNLDYGGGAFDKGSEYLAQEHGVDSQVYDPFNREKEHNDFVLKGFKKEPADTATVANVLNVIAEPEARLHVIKQVHNHIKPDGKAYFTVYEGDGKDKGSGNSRMTRDGWQEYRPTHSYVEEIKQVFPDVRLSGKTIVASKKAAKAYGGAIIPGPKLTEENADDFARRLIAWTFATAPLFQRASGGSVEFPVAKTKEMQDLHKKKHAKLKKMEPQKFLNETDPLHIGKGDRKVIDTFKHNIKHGDHLGPLKIYEGGHQDGRHRATAAKELGVKTVPVIDYRKAAGGSVVKRAFKVLSKFSR